MKSSTDGGEEKGRGGGKGTGEEVSEEKWNKNRKWVIIINNNEMKEK